MNGTLRPLMFFGWIVALATTITVVFPFSTTAPLDAKIATAVVNLAIGIAVGTLVGGVAARHPRPTTGSVATEGMPLRSDAGEARRHQRCRVQMLGPDGRQQRGELPAEPGIPVQEDDLARA